MGRAVSYVGRWYNACAVASLQPSFASPAPPLPHLVKLNSLVGTDANLILGTLGSKPKVNVPVEGGGGSGCPRGEKDVAVTLVELSSDL